jgi:serine/threonine-protein kinase
VLEARDGRVVVTDFGLARVEDGAVTSRSAPGVVSGTPAYMAPEQLTAASVDARVDQFAWAVLAWELLAGERPFPVEPAARLAAIRAGVAAPRALPSGLIAPLTRALASAPRDRFASMDALLAALEPRLAAPSASSGRRRVLIGAAAIAIAAGALVAVAPWRRGSTAARPARWGRRSPPPPSTPRCAAAATSTTRCVPMALLPPAPAPLLRSSSPRRARRPP